MCVNFGDSQMDPVKGSNRCQKEVGLEVEVHCFQWMVGAVRPGGPGTCIHCAALPATRRKAHGPGQVGAALPSSPRAKMAGGTNKAWRV